MNYNEMTLAQFLKVKSENLNSAELMHLKEHTHKLLSYAYGLKNKSAISKLNEFLDNLPK